MPQHVIQIRLTEEEGAVAAAAANAEHDKQVVTEFRNLLKESNAALRDLGKGPRSRAELEAAKTAATLKLSLLSAQPLSEQRDQLIQALTDTLATIEEGLRMHAEHALDSGR